MNLRSESGSSSPLDRLLKIMFGAHITARFRPLSCAKGELPLCACSTRLRRPVAGSWSRKGKRICEKQGNHAEGGSKPVNVEQRDVAFASLNPTNVGAVHTSFVGELLLGQPPEGPEHCDSFTEVGEPGFHLPHAYTQKVWVRPQSSL